MVFPVTRRAFAYPRVRAGLLQNGPIAERNDIYGDNVSADWTGDLVASKSKLKRYTPDPTALHRHELRQNVVSREENLSKASAQAQPPAAPATLPRYNVLIPIYDQFNTPDVNAPFEVLGNAALEQPPGQSKIFNIFVAASEKNTQSYEGAIIVAKVGFDEAIAMVDSGKVDILIVPGAGPAAINAVLKTIGDPEGIFGVINAFIKYGNEKGPSKVSPWLISICTGALIIASAGSFVGLTATTHWGGIPELQTICNAQGGPPSTIVRKRWVDAGMNGNGVRVLSSGGISCGLDAMLYFVKTVLGVQYAADISAMMDYVWNGGGFDGLPPSSAPGQTMLEALGVGWTTRQW